MKQIYKIVTNRSLVLALVFVSCLTGPLVGHAACDYYYDDYFSISGSSQQLCPDGTTVYVYTASGYPSNQYANLVWSVAGGTKVSQSGNQVWIKWNSPNGAVSASGSWVIQTWDYEDECPGGNYFYEHFSYTSNTISITPPYTVTISNTGSTYFCAGGSVLLTANAPQNNPTNYDLSSYTGTSQYTATGYIKLHPGFTFKAGVTGTSFSAKAIGNYQWYKDGSPIAGAVFQNYSATESGTYTVSTTYNSCSMTSTTGKTVTVVANPPVPSLSSETLSLVPGGIAKLSVSGGTNYQWYKNDVALSGVTSTQYSTTQSGTYKVTNTNLSTGCFSTSNTVNVSTSNNENFVVENVVTIPGVSTESQLHAQSLSSGNVSQAITYLNGQGKPVQNISVMGSPLQKDVVQPYSYDQLGRNLKSFLPLPTSQTSGYLVPNAVETSPGNGVYSGSQHHSFYTTLSSSVYDPDVAPFSVPDVEKSPLGRVVKQGGIGSDFQTDIPGGFKTISYGTNAANDIKIWSVSGSLPTNSTSWAPGTLSVTKVQGEIVNVESETIKDRQGRTLVERSKENSGAWAETYYLYDYRNNLRYILTPELIRILRNGTVINNPTQTQLDQWANQYKYDKRDRVVMSKVPGADSVVTVYDARDRVVLTQDGKQRLANQWSYTQYDALNRPVISGVYSPSSSISRAAMQSTVDSLNSGKGYENLTSVTSASSFFPTNNVEQLVITYYDDYTACSFCSQSAYLFVNENWNGVTSNEPFATSSQVYGKAVAGSVKVLGTSTWLNTVTYYNRYGQEIQTIASDHLGGYERVSTLFDFSGKALAALNTYSISGISVNSIRRRFTYEIAGRLLKTYHQINSQPEVTLSENQYNELGQLIDKQIHSVNASPYLQSLDYRYDIKGRLSKVNMAADSDPAPDYFGMEMGYANFIGTLSAGRTDGLVSGIRWKEDLTQYKEKGFNYSYNNFGWLTGSTFKKNNNNSWADLNGFFNESNLTYDYNGNIKTLNRTKSITAAASGTIDQLSYNYGAGGNQLFSVTDNASDPDYRAIGFNDGNPTGNDYSYDKNGNLKEDKNKGITAITYNLLNLSDTVKFNNNTYLKYTYDAGGLKLKQEYFYDDKPWPQADSLLSKTDYVGELVIVDPDGAGPLSAMAEIIQHEEGRIVAPNNTNLVSNPTQDANGMEGFTASGSVTLTAEFTGGQNYVKAVCNQSTSTPGVYPIGGSYSVKAGDSYTFKVLGYQSVGTTASLYVWGNNGDLLWPGAVLPSGAGNENYATSTFTIPSGVTQIQIGVLWNGAAVGNTIYINEVKLYKSDFEYQYYLSDQVGSPRVVLQTTPTTHTLAATMETENHSKENGKWLNLDASQFRINVAANATLGGNEAIEMDNSYRVGPARSFAVFPGDVYNASVQAYYTATSGYTQAAAGVMASSLKSILSGGIAAIDGGITGAYNGTGSNFALSPFEGSTKPSAFLNYILFDLEFQPLKAKSFPVQNNPNVRHTVQFDAALTIEEAGYLFVYLSYDNENTLPVYFDDLKVTYTESPVLQINGYYPFGMIAYQLNREGEQLNRYLYQGKELDPKTQWHDFGARMYYADLGRWLAIDPEGQFSSPYNGMGNNPVMGVDPDGRFVFLAGLAVAALVGGSANLAIEAIEGDIHNFGDGLKAFGIGAGQGALGYATGGGSSFATLGRVAANTALNVASSQIEPLQVSAGPASIGISPFFGWGAGGLTASTNISGSLAIDEHFSIGGNIGLRPTERVFSYGGSWNNNGWSISYSRNTWRGAETDNQVNGTWSLRHKEWQLINLENDARFFGDGYDGWRTAAASVGYKNFTIGMNMLTSYGFDERESKPGDSMWGLHIPKLGNNADTDQGTWTNASVFYSNLFVGYRHGNIAYRAGVDSPGVQDAFQNFVHRFVTKATPYFLPREGPTNAYFYYGLYSSFTHY